MPLQEEPFDLKKWQLKAKAPENMRSYDGDVQHFKAWWSRLRDHCSISYIGWRAVLDWAVKQEDLHWQPMRMLLSGNNAALHVEKSTVLNLTYDQITSISTILWSYLGYCLQDTLVEDRDSITCNEENGLELIRKMHNDALGGTTETQVSGKRCFHRVPRCDDMKNLASHISKWHLHRVKYCSQMPKDDLYFMFLDILPKDFAETVEQEAATYEGALKFVSSSSQS